MLEHLVVVVVVCGRLWNLHLSEPPKKKWTTGSTSQCVVAHPLPVQPAPLDTGYNVFYHNDERQN